MNKNFVVGILIIVILLVVIGGCEKEQIDSKVIPPSAQDCIKHGGNYQIITNPDGSQTGRCVLPDGIICTDEQYYKTEEGCYSDQLAKKR